MMFLSELQDSTCAPGGVLAVDRDGRFEVGTFGLREARGAPVADDDRWHIGSVTKGMTATLAARLVEAGAIGWSTTLGDTLGGAPCGMRAEHGDLTLIDLLTHRSGLVADDRLAHRLRDFLTAAQDGDPQPARRRYAARILARPAAVPRGSLLYSNAGYVVAGLMLETATGRDWETLMREWLFAPLGMTGAGFGPPAGAAPKGHRRTLFGGLKPAGARGDNPALLGPAGRVHATAPDMLRYLAAHRVRDPAFLTAGSWERLQSPIGKEAHAMGWFSEAPGRLWHNGSNMFWYAFAGFDRVSGVGVFGAVNAADFRGAEPALYEIARNVCGDRRRTPGATGA